MRWWTNKSTVHLAYRDSAGLSAVRVGLSWGVSHGRSGWDRYIGRRLCAKTWGIVSR
jgi:hypothetical protein